MSKAKIPVPTDLFPEEKLLIVLFPRPKKPKAIQGLRRGLGNTKATAIRQKIEDTLKKLSPNEKKVIKLRYGLKDGISYSVAETARICKKTQDRVRKLEVQAFRKLDLKPGSPAPAKKKNSRRQRSTA